MTGLLLSMAWSESRMKREDPEAEDRSYRGRSAWSWRDSKGVGGVGQWGKEVGDKVTAKEAGISRPALPGFSMLRSRRGEDKSAEETEKELLESRLGAVSGPRRGTVSPGGE